MSKPILKYILLFSVVALAVLLNAGVSDASVATTSRFSINRIYEGNDGSLLYLQTVGDQVYGFSESSLHGYAYVLQGTLDESVISATFWDVPKHGREKTGTVELEASEAGQRLHWLSSSTSLGAHTWEAISPASVPATDGPAAYQELGTGNLTGAFNGDGDSHYFVREVGGKIVWVAESAAANGQTPAWISVFIGERQAGSVIYEDRTIQTDIEGTFVDVPKGERASTGELNAVILSSRTLSLYQVNPDDQQFLEPDYAIDWDIFENEIQAALDGNTVGYAYELGQGDAILRSGSGGHRKLSGDGGPLPFEITTQSQTFSTAKTVSAVAMVKALTDRGLSVNNSIAPFLPACWEQGEGIEDVTFRDVLDHTSGMSTSGSDPYESIKTLIATPPDLDQGRRYNNPAYSLLRYLVPLVAFENEAQMIFVNNDCETDGFQINQQIASIYTFYQNLQVLPNGSVMTYLPDEDIAAYIYDRPYGYVTGAEPNPSAPLNPGAGYLATSAVDFGEFLGALTQGDIIPVPQLGQMYSGNLGFDGPVNGTLGQYYTKNGANGGACGIRGSAQLMIYPNEMHAYVMVNSRINSESPRYFFDLNNDENSDGSGMAPAGINGGDIPVMGDFDGDNLDDRIDDIGFFRPSDRSWRYDFEMDGTIDLVVPNWGLSGDIPFAGDFDKDGDFDDVALFRPYARKLFFDYNHDGTTNFQLDNWGMPCDLPVAGDFDGDGFANDVAVYRRSTQTRYYDYEHNGIINLVVSGWGGSNHVPAVGDFDNDGVIDDFMLFDGGAGIRYVDFDQDTESDLILDEKWGGSGDIPLVGSLTATHFVNDVILYRPSTGLAGILENAFDAAIK